MSKEIITFNHLCREEKNCLGSSVTGIIIRKNEKIPDVIKKYNKMLSHFHVKICGL